MLENKNVSSEIISPQLKHCKATPFRRFCAFFRYSLVKWPDQQRQEETVICRELWRCMGTLRISFFNFDATHNDAQLKDFFQLLSWHTLFTVDMAPVLYTVGQQTKFWNMNSSVWTVWAVRAVRKKKVDFRNSEQLLMVFFSTFGGQEN